MTQSMNIPFASFDMAFESASYEVMRISPQGKQKFAKFAIGIPKLLWDQNPISPAALETEVQRLALAAIKQAAIKARTAGETSLTVSYSLVDILQAIMPESAKLTKEELESWLKANDSNFRAFLISRGHADDATLQGKINKLVELLGKAASPNPGWKQINLELILSLVAFLGASVSTSVSGADEVKGEARDASPETTCKLLAKVEALMDVPAMDVDAL